MSQNLQVEISATDPNGNQIGETVITDTDTIQQTSDQISKIFDSTEQSMDFTSEDKSMAIETLEKDITKKLFTIYQSKFWVGAVDDMDQYKSGVKAMSQITKQLRGLMELKKGSPLNSLF